MLACPSLYCFQWFKDTKMKANHNNFPSCHSERETVSNGSKILKWKQITTYTLRERLTTYCFQWFKDTKMKANHNSFLHHSGQSLTVSNGSKILKWKQITTSFSPFFRKIYCFQWFKDTKMKANHNFFFLIVKPSFTVSNGSKILKWKQITTQFLQYNYPKQLFPMVQRY